MYVAKNIKHLRTQKGWTQKELSARIGIVASYLSGFENGTKTPSISHLKKIAEIFDVSPGEIIDIDFTDSES